MANRPKHWHGAPQSVYQIQSGQLGRPFDYNNINKSPDQFEPHSNQPQSKSSSTTLTNLNVTILLICFAHDIQQLILRHRSSSMYVSVNLLIQRKIFRETQLSFRNLEISHVIAHCHDIKFTSKQQGHTYFANRLEVLLSINLEFHHLGEVVCELMQLELRRKDFQSPRAIGLSGGLKNLKFQQ